MNFLYIRLNFNPDDMNVKITLWSVLLFSAAAVSQSHHNNQRQTAARTNVTSNVYAVTAITATIAYQGYDDTSPYLGQGEYEIFPDNVNGIIDKPVILVEGFDPNDTRAIPAIYNMLNYGAGQNLATDLRNLGYDIVILNFPNYTRPATSTLVAGGADYIQRNAMVLTELLSQVNAMKVGTEQNVVIGPSMGGLIARYALRYMEMNSLDHDTRLYISFDAPHKGANIPIGFQHLFNYMANGPLGDATIQVLVDAMLKSNASREMLIDQFEGHLQSGSNVEFDGSVTLPTGKPGFRDAFQAELDAMGFPQQSRNIAIANGAGNGAMNGTPDMVVMDHTFNITSSQRAIINLRFTPLANQTNQVSRFRGQTNVFGIWITVYESSANSTSPPTSDGLDSAPGGKFDISSLADVAGTNALLTEFLANLNISYFDFIPTHSSLALSGTQNWYEPVTASSTTPFAATFIPTANENHVTVTAGNIAFVLDEILNPQMGVAQHAFQGLQVQNPVGNDVSIFSGSEISNAEISICDITGKSVFRKSNVNLEGNMHFAVTLTPGMYFLSIRNSEGQITKKLVKQ
jgi:pimeloyl-ACP methyl ester carboxylesterase